MPKTDRAAPGNLLEQTLIVALRDYDFHGTVACYDTVCDAICAYVDAMRASECSPEEVVIQIKRAARTAGYGPPSNFTRREFMPERDQRLEGFVTCAIRRYFQLSGTTMDTPLVWIPVRLVC